MRLLGISQSHARSKHCFALSPLGRKHIYCSLTVCAHINMQLPVHMELAAQLMQLQYMKLAAHVRVHKRALA